MNTSDSLQHILNKQLSHHDLIAELYDSKAGISESPENTKALAKLFSSRMVRQSEDNIFQLSTPYRAGLSHCFMRSNNRRVDPSVEGAIKGIRDLCSDYIKAKTGGATQDKDVYFGDLQEAVSWFLQDLEIAISALWTQVDEKFGRYYSMMAKNNECERAIGRVRSLSDSLTLIDMDELSALTGGDSSLFAVLVRPIDKGTQKCLSDLEDVNKRLSALMGEFRTMDKKTILVKQYISYMEKNPDYEMVDLMAISGPISFKLLSPHISVASMPDPQSVGLESELADIIVSADAKVREQDSTEDTPSVEPIGELNSDQASRPPEPDPVADEVDALLTLCLEDGQVHSAREHYLKLSPKWKFEDFMYALFGAYSQFADSAKRDVVMNSVKWEHPDFSGNVFIDDLHVSVPGYHHPEDL